MPLLQDILQFVSQLKENNNREWFQENKEWYNTVRLQFEELTASLIEEISKFDDEIKNVTPKECIFRIYRDIRFSHDKTPYKTYMGTYIAAGGRKSIRGGYYLHLDPDSPFISVGIWAPQPNLLKALRQSIYDNIEELDEIRSDVKFSKYFKNFYQADKLKTVPREFPKDFPQAELLKLKHYLVDYYLGDKILKAENPVPQIVDIFKAGYPFNHFLNYTVDEVI
ncbi:DUF2461 domain-containing protein [Paludibacter sp. 221]|uniref:DUF2461 domain-containing protein n=1 Tax=Paludibacter sp. 221 TaxID=2302939 RepID=UPI0013D3A8B7|nr:DUF2461 domain-containing protein [Paludibacter sp. 221]NDV46368.1 DUF2461 domain-containing protein [Paludibacter sp. 221]